MKNPDSEITRLLGRWTAGDLGARDQLMPLVLEEVRLLARRALAHERANHTLQPTALVNEVYLRLVDRSKVRWENRTHFFRALAEITRCILVDHARARATVKRGGEVWKVSLDDPAARRQPFASRDPELIALDDSLKALEQEDSEKYQIVILRYFIGLTKAEIAEVLGLSINTIGRRYQEAIDWLHQEISKV